MYTSCSVLVCDCSVSGKLNFAIARAAGADMMAADMRCWGCAYKCQGTANSSSLQSDGDMLVDTAIEVYYVTLFSLITFV